MTFNRTLDKGNATPGGLGNDFLRLGLSLWPALKNVNSRASRWNSELESLNTARNAIAHDDQSKFAMLKADGDFPITLTVVKRWRRSLDALAPAMDDVVGDYFNTLVGLRPW
ncbi:hypothetical protein [Embleya sp. MST-111070]|uniref:hypothetical protein n=1 Tax=Embleya sp. MST-111070 TaxID=3398231 RepID=UPI003F733D72